MSAPYEPTAHFEHTPLDTLAIATMLEESGTPAKQAKTFAKLFGIMNTSHLANKIDVENIRKDIEILRKDTNTSIESLRKDTETAIESLRKDMKIEMGLLKVDIIKWVVSLMIVQTAFLAGLMKIMH